MAMQADRGNAIFSDGGEYRYQLERGLSSNNPKRKTLAVIMVNPSKAGAKNNDQTVTKLIGFCDRLGFNRLVVGNKFAYVTTNVEELAECEDPVGPDNDKHLEAILREVKEDQGHTLLFAWGPLSKIPFGCRRRWWRLTRMAINLGKKAHCLGVASDGQPLHPLMISYDTPLVPWQHPPAG